MSAGASNLSPDQQAKVEQLIREARAAIKLGDKAAARLRLQEAVTIDQYSEQGWYWLASVVDTDEERKTCLGNVVVINPNNEKAKQLLDRLSGNLNIGLMDSEPELEGSGGPLQAPTLLQNRRVLLIGGVVVGVLLLVIVLSALSGGGSTTPTPTTAQLSDGTGQPVAQDGTPSATSDSATQAATTSPTATPLPTETPEPTETPASQRPTPLPPPPASLILSGRLTAISGSLVSSRRDDQPVLPVSILDPYGKNVRQVSGSEVGDHAILTPDGLRLVFARYNLSTNVWTLRLMNSNGTQATELSRLWSNLPLLAKVRHPSFSRNGDVLVFSATNITENDAHQNLYIVQSRAITLLTTGSVESTEEAALPAAATATARPVTPTIVTPGGRAPTPTPLAQLRRLTTKDSGINTTPSISSDGRQIVYVGDTRPLGQDVFDLFLMPAGGGTPSNLTKDNTTMLEGEPAFSPDNKRVTYQAAQQGSKTNDIFVINTDGSNRVQLTNGADNIRPHWSPDGKFIAFSSNRTGRYEIYLINVESKETYQVTFMEGRTDVICTGWSAK